MGRAYMVERGVVTPVAPRPSVDDNTVVGSTEWYTRRDPQEVEENEARIAARRERERKGEPTCCI